MHLFNSETLSGRYGGTGLGLSLVKELVEAHHGRVGISSRISERDRGTTVFIVLPVKQPATEMRLIDTAKSALMSDDITPGILKRSYSTISQAAAPAGAVAAESFSGDKAL